MKIGVTKLKHPVLIEKYQIEKYMKRIINLLVLFFALMVYAQTDDLHQGISDSLFKKYPEAHDINRVKDSSIYSIEF